MLLTYGAAVKFVLPRARTGNAALTTPEAMLSMSAHLGPDNYLCCGLRMQLSYIPCQRSLVEAQLRLCQVSLGSLGLCHPKT